MILLGALVSLHQFIFWGSFFEFKDIHHELFIVTLIFAGIIVLLVTKQKRRRK